MPFSPKTLEFIFENHIHDSKEWFNAHRSDFEQYVKEPFREFVTQLTPTMLKIDPQFICDPKRLSRIYRDARYAKGKSIFRDYIWYSFGRKKEDVVKTYPEYYFSISPTGFDYGCGYYCPTTETMTAMRRLIIAGDPVFGKAKAAYDSQKVFAMGGTEYKRDRYPDQSPEKRLWLNRKDIFFFTASSDFDVLYSPDLPKKIAKDFKKIAPIYDFFIKAEQIKDNI